MKKTVFNGCATALVTPMNNDGSVNYDVLKKIINSQIEGNIDALVICGTTGEGATLTNEEHIEVIKKSVEFANGKVPIIAGTGSNDTKYAVELSKEALDVGANALLMVTPYYNKTSQHGLVAHYNYIAERIKAPIILYNVPSRTGVNIKPETYKELSKIENVVAAKEANGDIEAAKRTIELCGDDLTIYTGNDDQIYEFCEIGGKGVISVISNILPNETHDMVMEYLNGNKEKSKELTVKYHNLMKALFADVNPVPIKEAMNLMNLNVGPCRLPLVPMLEETKETLVKALKELYLI